MSFYQKARGRVFREMVVTYWRRDRVDVDSDNRVLDSEARAETRTCL
jgi:hypothetical protein